MSTPSSDGGATPAWSPFHESDRVRQAAGRDREPTAGIIDGQSVKAAASVPAASRGFDGAKKVNGRKRQIVVDALGLPLTVMVTAASATGWGRHGEESPNLQPRVRLRQSNVVVWQLSPQTAEDHFPVDLPWDLEPYRRQPWQRSF